MATNPREVLQRNWQLLVQNMIPGEDLLTRAGAVGLLTDSMVKEIQEDTSQEVRNRKLLELMSVRMCGSHVLDAFCDCLLLSGHVYLAEMLRQEGRTFMSTHLLGPWINALFLVRAGQGDGLGTFDLDEVMKKFPRMVNVLKGITADDRNHFTQLIRDKIQEMIVKQIWLHNSRQKTTALKVKQKQLEDNWKYSEVLKQKDKVIDSLTQQLDVAHKQIHNLSRDLENAKCCYHKEMENQNQALVTQMKFNTANDSTVKRLEEKNKATESGLAELLRKVLRCLNDGQLGRAPVFEYKDTSITTLHKLTDVMEAVMEKLDNYLYLQKKHTALQLERDELIKVMDGSEGQTDLHKAFTHYKECKQRQFDELKHKLEITQNMLDGIKRNSAKASGKENRKTEPKQQHAEGQKNAKKSVSKVHSCVQTENVKIVRQEEYEEHSQSSGELEQVCNPLTSHKDIVCEHRETLQAECPIVMPDTMERTGADLQRSIGNLRAVIKIRDEELDTMTHTKKKLVNDILEKEAAIKDLVHEFDKITTGMELHVIKSLHRRKNCILSGLANKNSDVLHTGCSEHVNSCRKNDSTMDTTTVLTARPEMSQVSRNISLHSKRFLFRKMGLASAFDLTDPVIVPEPDLQACRRAADLCQNRKDVTQSQEYQPNISRRSVGVSLPAISRPFPSLQLQPTSRQVSIPKISHHGGTLATLVQTSGRQQHPSVASDPLKIKRSNILVTFGKSSTSNAQLTPIAQEHVIKTSIAGPSILKK